MNWLSGVAKAVGGSGPAPQNPQETIDKLCDRVRHSTLLEDRRASVQALKGLARDWKAEVGRSGLSVLASVLESDGHDSDMTQVVLETLKVLFSPDTKEGTTKNGIQENGGDLGAQFCNIFVKDSANIGRVLMLLEQRDFYTRYDCLHLLSILLQNNPHEIQNSVLTSPLAVSKLMDLLEEKRDAIRTEAILLLIALTQSNADLQKIITFENAFERLFGLISDPDIEPIIVQDCLTLMLNLLRHNVSNQNFFRETSCVQRLPALLYRYMLQQDEEGYPEAQQASSDNIEWTEQSVVNCVLVLRLIRSLVVPGSANTTGNQNVINTAETLPPVLELSLNYGVPLRVKTQALYALAEIIRGNLLNQAILNESLVYVPVVTSSGGSREGSMSELAPKSALLLIVSVAVTGLTDVQNVPQTRDLNLELTQVRAAATYVAECYLYNNSEGQMSLAMSTMNPPPDEIVGYELTEQPLANSVVISSVLDWHTSREDTLRVWFAATILSHIVSHSEKCKEIATGMYNQQMQRHKKKHTDDIQDEDDEVPSLVQSVGHALLFAARDKAPLRIQLAYLSLLSIWLWECIPAVKEYLSDGMNLQFLIEQISQSSGIDPLVQGMSAFLLGVCYFYQNDESGNTISRAQLHQIITTRVGVDQFSAKLTRLRDDKRFVGARSLEDATSGYDESGQLNIYFESSTADFIKEQLSQIQRGVSTSPQDIARRHNTSKSIDQNFASEDTVRHLQQAVTNKDQEIQTLTSKVNELEQMIVKRSQTYEAEIVALHKTVKELQYQLANSVKRAEALETDQNDLLILLAEHDMETKNMRHRLRELGDDQFVSPKGEGDTPRGNDSGAGDDRVSYESHVGTFGDHHQNGNGGNYSTASPPTVVDSMLQSQPQNQYIRPQQQHNQLQQQRNQSQQQYQPQQYTQQSPQQQPQQYIQQSPQQQPQQYVQQSSQQHIHQQDRHLLSGSQPSVQSTSPVMNPSSTKQSPNTTASKLQTLPPNMFSGSSAGEMDAFSHSTLPINNGASFGAPTISSLPSHSHHQEPPRSYRVASPPSSTFNVASSTVNNTGQKTSPSVRATSPPLPTATSPPITASSNFAPLVPRPPPSSSTVPISSLVAHTNNGPKPIQQPPSQPTVIESQVLSSESNGVFEI